MGTTANTKSMITSTTPASKIPQTLLLERGNGCRLKASSKENIQKQGRDYKPGKRANTRVEEEEEEEEEEE